MKNESVATRLKTAENQRLRATPLFFSTLVLLALVFGPAQAQSLRVSANRRYLVRADGTPFFWLGDTAWKLFSRLTREEADQYLRKRAEQGFTVILAVVLAEQADADTTPEGYRPLQNNDPTRPDAEYFRKVDDVLDLAARYGLTIGLLPTWGDKVNGGRQPAIFTAQNAQTYGRFLGERYKARPNLIWILGGDQLVDKPEWQAVWRAMAEGITEGIGGADKGLLTFHPRGGRSSSTEFHQDDWLDFNMQQTGHCRYVAEHEKIAQDYQLTPAKPVINGEPIYEEHPVCFNAADLGYSNAHDVRKAAYLAVLAGAPGHTYGCHAVWQFYVPGGRTPSNAPLRPWRESLELPGASQMQHLRTLIESRPMLERVPNPNVLVGPVSASDGIQASVGNHYLFVYSALGLPFTVRLGTLSGDRVKAHWFNPRTGEARSIGQFDNRGQQKFSPPRNNRDGLDWVLILDDLAKNYPVPVARK